MPRYEYLCTSCKYITEAPRSMAERHDAPPCEDCGGTTEFRLSRFSITQGGRERSVPDTTSAALRIEPGASTRTVGCDFVGDVGVSIEGASWVSRGDRFRARHTAVDARNARLDIEEPDIG